MLRLLLLALEEDGTGDFTTARKKYMNAAESLHVTIAKGITP